MLSRDILVTIRARNLMSFTDYVAARQAHAATTTESPGRRADRSPRRYHRPYGRRDGSGRRGARWRLARNLRGRRFAKRARSRTGSSASSVRRCRPWAGAADTTSHARDSLLGLNRLLVFLSNKGEKFVSLAHRERLEVLRQDVAALGDYENRLTDKVQFLLDSTLGFINVEQNKTFKLLTIASVIGIPPTFVVGLYGMNFKNMPEYDWPYGYQWGLFLVLMSVVVPVVWLRLKGMVLTRRRIARWRSDQQLSGRSRHLMSCSFCSSIAPALPAG